MGLALSLQCTMRYRWKKTKNWRKVGKRTILVFTGLFSAAVAALVAVSIQDLRPNSQDTSAFYLQNIYQLLADPNRTNFSIPPALANPPPFSPPSYAVWVHSLWFLSLAISLSCGLCGAGMGSNGILRTTLAYL
ncbi:hypothetical protein EDB92DRAFT_1867280 [Lactarius akahatsu]|uniref:DUF6535 domain-containing protein n=1 Tax=Lactarius akahatsu TaxID=416441 RepID=A0AAD4LHI9_9AGAM|nr:hypothetical protein EDB92DRAFT_1867280 [Lactarius akahatsu]